MWRADKEGDQGESLVQVGWKIGEKADGKLTSIIPSNSPNMQLSLLSLLALSLVPSCLARRTLNWQKCKATRDQLRSSRSTGPIAVSNSPSRPSSQPRWIPDPPAPSTSRWSNNLSLRVQRPKRRRDPRPSLQEIQARQHFHLRSHQRRFPLLHHRVWRKHVRPEAAVYEGVQAEVERSVYVLL